MKTIQLKKSMRTAFPSLALALGLLATAPAQAETAPATTAEDENAPRVQLAILLDTSGSMEGLINQARAQIWQVVNTFISAKQDGKTPFVEVALYEYGKDGLSAETNWVRQILPLTRDLDKVSEQLFALSTNGGSEYCGAVIERATLDLEWDKSPDIYKAIFIAGNEPFTQGPVDARKACRAAASKGVVVNTIHCGDITVGVNDGWKDGAVAADGRYMAIDSNQAIANVNAPQDAEILKLNEELNKTYLGYGSGARDAMANQVAQDANAAKMSAGVIASRAAAKSSYNYSNERWDLVDASKKEGFDVATVQENDLPENMRKMTVEERKEHIEKNSKERAKLQERILELNKARATFVVEELKKSAKGKDGETLDAAVIKAVRSQATAKKITFEQ